MQDDMKLFTFEFEGRTFSYRAYKELDEAGRRMIVESARLQELRKEGSEVARVSRAMREKMSGAIGVVENEQQPKDGMNKRKT